MSAAIFATSMACALSTLAAVEQHPRQGDAPWPIRCCLATPVNLDSQESPAAQTPSPEATFVPQEALLCADTSPGFQSAEHHGDAFETAPPEEPRDYHLILADMSRAFQTEATSEDFSVKAEAIREVCRLHTELIHDPRLSQSPTLQQYRGRAYYYLLRMERELGQELRALASRRERELARLTPEEKQKLEQLQVSAALLAMQIEITSTTLGGPVKLFTGSRGARAGGALLEDHGQELVDLIQRTISPDHWDVAGGQGTIVYYAPLHALIITASAEEHRNLGRLLGGLRAAGP